MAVEALDMLIENDGVSEEEAWLALGRIKLDTPSVRAFYGEARRRLSKRR